jgi:thiosulfate reductase cytochrome b subunit
LVEPEAQAEVIMRSVEVYSLYERIWHWLQAGAILLLTLTGMEIHAPDRLRLFGFMAALRIHETAALFTIANAFLSLFTHLATGAIREYLPAPQDFFTQAARQARYYLVGIFRGEPHPFERRQGNKLNLLQQLTYLMILNLLLPAQIVSGALLWEAARFPAVVDRFGGLPAIAAVHVAAAWLFVAFVVIHVYLTTTGPSPFAHIRAMLTGYEPHDDHEPADPIVTSKEELDHESF